MLNIKSTTLFSFIAFFTFILFLDDLRTPRGRWRPSLLISNMG